MPVPENFNKTSGITKDGVMRTELALIPTANAAAIVVSDDDRNPSMKNGENNNDQKKKKKGGPFSFFRAALVVMRSDSKKKAAPKAVDHEVNNPKENWKKIVGSMRPLHLQDNQSDSHPPSLPPASPPHSVGCLDDLILNNMMIQQRPSSPAPSSLSGGTMSQYASASNLQELDKSSSDDDGDDDYDPDEVFDALCGDEMIDAKAEEFIAQFYKQMKLQQVGHAMTSRSHQHQHHHHHHKGKNH